MLIHAIKPSLDPEQAKALWHRIKAMISKVWQRLSNKGYYHNYKKKPEFNEILEDSKISHSVQSSIWRHRKIMVDSDSIDSSMEKLKPIECI